MKVGITVPRGFKAGGIYCGIKKSKAKDLALIYSEKRAEVAACFTTNRIQAAPIKVSREHVGDGFAQVVIINSGNANACTGEKGIADAYRMAELSAKRLGVKKEDVLVASTGIIGELLPMDRIEKGIEKLAREISVDEGAAAAEAIMTTDTNPKSESVTVPIKEGASVTIGGIAKGAGMLCPSLATLLSFFTTDVSINQSALGKALQHAVEYSFNRTNIDGDMSTNDTVIILANGMAGNEKIEFGTDEFMLFQQALDRLAVSLAKMLVRDGEGATKLIEVKVVGARTEEEAKRVAFFISNSNLVKTALFGQDPNWGRIIAASGAAGVGFVEDNITLVMGGESIIQDGRVVDFNRDRVVEVLSSNEINISLGIGRGKAEATYWTCDLSEEYVRINCAYNT